jgi:hypothetical protein
VDPISYVIKSARSPVHCNNIAPPRYKVGDKWYCSYQDLRECHDPAMLPVDEVKIDLVTVNNIRLGKSIYTKEQLEEFATFQDSQGTRKAYPLAETAGLAYMGRNEKGEWGLAGGSGRDELLPTLQGSGPHDLLTLPPADGVGRTSASGDHLLEGGNNREVRGFGVWVLTPFWGTLFQLAVSPFNWIDGIMEDVARRVMVMLNSEATRAPAGEEAEERSLEDLRRKYPWWLGGRGGVKASTPAQESSAEADNTVTLFEGKATRV